MFWIWVLAVLVWSSTPTASLWGLALIFLTFAAIMLGLRWRFLTRFFALS